MFLSTQDLAFIANRLQIPVIFSDILSGRAMFTEDVQYGLSEVLSDFQPDSALLAIALSAQTLTAKTGTATAPARMLEMECKRITQEYGTIWSKNAQRQPVDTEDVFDVLIHTSDDLETIAKLLEHFEETLAAQATDITALCKILKAQAKAQAMVAEAFMSVAEEQAAKTASIGTHTYTQKSAKTLPAAAFTMAAALSESSNVVEFPRTH